MQRTTALVVALAIGGAAVLGVIAATRTTTLGASAKKVSSSTINTRQHKLDAFEASLRKALESRPPALPKVPKVTAPAAAPIAAAVGGSGGAPQVVYHRPAPIVVVKHTHHGDDGGSDGEHGGDGGGGGGGDD
jgi:hypothetical protein